jgi:hypothetical protein
MYLMKTSPNSKELRGVLSRPNSINSAGSNEIDQTSQLTPPSLQISHNPSNPYNPTNPLMYVYGDSSQSSRTLPPYPAQGAASVPVAPHPPAVVMGGPIAAAPSVNFMYDENQLNMMFNYDQFVYRIEDIYPRELTAGTANLLVIRINERIPNWQNATERIAVVCQYIHSDIGDNNGEVFSAANGVESGQGGQVTMYGMFFSENIIHSQLSAKLLAGM